MDPENPYAAGSAPIAPLPSETLDTIELLPEPKGNPVGAGMDRLKEGLADFKQGPGAFIGYLAAFLGVVIVTSFIPGLSVAMNLAMYVLTAGLLINIRRARAGQGIHFETFFEGFKHRRAGALIGLGALYLFASTVVLLLIIIALFAVVGFENLFALFAFSFEPAQSAPPSFNGFDENSLIMLVIAGASLGAFLYLLLGMAFFFAGHLVTFSEVTLLESLKLSFFGCLRNIGPLFIWSLLAMAACVVAALPCGLGLLVVVPVLWASSYQAFLDIFTVEGVGSSADTLSARDPSHLSKWQKDTRRTR